MECEPSEFQERIVAAWERKARRWVEARGEAQAFRYQITSLLEAIDGAFCQVRKVKQPGALTTAENPSDHVLIAWQLSRREGDRTIVVRYCIDEAGRTSLQVQSDNFRYVDRHYECTLESTGMEELTAALLEAIGLDHYVDLAS